MNAYKTESKKEPNDRELECIQVAPEERENKPE